MKRKLQFIWQILKALGYLAVVIGVVNIAANKFETVVFAVLVQIYAAVLYNFSVLGSIIDANNYAGFVRFKILAAAQGTTENEDGTFEEQEKAIVDAIASDKNAIII